MMMPVVLGDIKSVPAEYQDWHKVLEALFDTAKEHNGQVGYLTIDEKVVESGETHRRAGKHVDGVYNGECGGWGPVNTGGGWGVKGAGMYTISSHAGCKAWNQSFEGWPGRDGECDHLANQCSDANAEIFEPHRAYWVDGMCVHESLRQVANVFRTFMRLSMPSCAPWFDGYTVNPLGVLPTGPILPRRQYMDA